MTEGQARNKLEPFRSSLVFEGKRLYVRTAKNLYCIGATLCRVESSAA